MTNRRRVLQAGAGVLFSHAPFAWVWAQSESAARLVRAPKHALVIGNSGYKNVPLLVNPANDARAIAGVLGESGFAVRTVLDAPRGQMLEAIAAYAAELQSRKSVGVFYYAGHGVQLAWRNFLLPVDAAIAKAEDIPPQCVDVTELIGGIKRAANPMNVIILDACRENPFGSVRVEQKGLSQMDAPSGTLLAYATAPGNLASDGAGANGLYTENLLREMRVREAKIEDVFKRVRLNVRLASKGAQIPWESTSLEEDFYFIPPEQLRKLSQQQEEALFREERTLFEAARDSGGAARLEDYLRRYPSGRFVELAQLMLDRELAAKGETPVEPAPSQGNPHTQGSAKADTRVRVGDMYVYRVIDRFKGEERTARQRITGIRGIEVDINDGAMILDLLGNFIKHPNGARYTPRQDIPLEYAVGKRWSTRYEISGTSQASAETTHRITAREKVTVPLGTFDCFRLEGHGYSSAAFRPPSQLETIYWRSPEVWRPIAFEVKRRSPRGDVYEDQRWELREIRKAD